MTIDEALKIKPGQVFYYSGMPLNKSFALESKAVFFTIFYGDKITITTVSFSRIHFTVNDTFNDEINLFSTFQRNILDYFSIEKPLIGLRTFKLKNVIESFAAYIREDNFISHTIIDCVKQDGIKNGKINNIRTENCGDWFFNSLNGYNEFDDDDVDHEDDELANFIFLAIPNSIIYKKELIENYVNTFCNPFLAKIKSDVVIRKVEEVHDKFSKEYGLIYELVNTSKSSNDDLAMNYMFCMSLLRSSYIDYNSISISYFILSKLLLQENNSLTLAMMSHGNFIGDRTKRDCHYSFSHIPDMGIMQFKNELDLTKLLTKYIKDDGRPNFWNLFSENASILKNRNIFENNFIEKIINKYSDITGGANPFINKILSVSDDDLKEINKFLSK